MDFENEAYLRVCEPRDRSFLPLKYTYLLFNIICYKYYHSFKDTFCTLYNEGIVLV